MRRTTPLESRLNLAQLVSDLNALIADPALSPEGKMLEVAKVLRRGGKQGNGFTRSEFLSVLDEHADERISSLLSPAAVRSWETGRSLIPAEQIEKILRTYSKIDQSSCVPQSLVTDLKLTRLQAHAERYKNKTLLSSLFQPRDLPKLQHAGFADPANSAGDTYSFWIADPRRADRDLDDFVALSEAEQDISDAHPDLTPHERRKLYTRWLRLSPLSFLSLRRYDARKGVAPVAAVSIMLPLTSDAAARIWGRQIDAVQLADDDFELRPGQPLHLLLDTWIVKREERGRSGIDYVGVSRRVDHEGFGGMLLTLHAALFWDGQQDASLLVEPDTLKIATLCTQLGFMRNKSDSRANDLGCYRFYFIGWEKPNFETQSRLVRYVQELRKFRNRYLPASYCQQHHGQIKTA